MNALRLWVLKEKENSLIEKYMHTRIATEDDEVEEKNYVKNNLDN